MFEALVQTHFACATQETVAGNAPRPAAGSPSWQDMGPSSIAAAAGQGPCTAAAQGETGFSLVSTTISKSHSGYSI